MNQEKSLIILRGLPGSGKSTLATILSENGKYPVFSIDDYFTNEKGDYKFEFGENHLAYKRCENKTIEAMIRREEKIILHNVFSMDWEMGSYFKLASEHGYAVFVCTVENRHGGQNIHDIPHEQLKKMAEKFRVKLL